MTRGSKLEVGLLLVGLAALAFGAGAVGWAIGRGNRSARTVTAAVSQAPTTGGATVRGDPAAGKTVFVTAGCGSCHALSATASKGTVGPDLDQVKLSPSQIRDWVEKGKGGMPSFKGRLSEKQLADLAVFLAQVEKSR